MSVTAASSDGIEKRTSLVVSLDDALLALAEVMKTLIRESFHLGGQVVNGFASTALHLTFEPGYLTRVRHRFTNEIVASKQTLQRSESWGRAVVTNDRRVRLSSASGHLAPTPGQDEGHLLPQLLQWLRQSAKERAENGWFQVTGVPLKYVAASPGLLEDLSGYLQLKVDGLIGGVRFVVRRGAAFVVSKPHVQTAPLPLSRTLSTPPLHAATSYTSATCRIIEDVCGYPVETHTVRTLDGYLLVLVRIPRPSSRRVVFLQHGLLDSPVAWVSSGRLASLAFRSYQAGYDVFLGTYRGTSEHPISNQPQPQPSAFRRVHTHLNHSDTEYWNYSVDDHALDVFASVQYIRQLKANEAEMAHGREEQVATPLPIRKRDGNRKSPQQLAGTGSTVNTGATRRRQKRRSSDAATIGSCPDDPSEIVIVGIGHSMGGCSLLLYALFCAAIGVPHGLSKMVLLSPAGFHKEQPVLIRVITTALAALLTPIGNGPFPVASSALQHGVAKLLQDFKRTRATADVLAVCAARFFGGSSADSALRKVEFTEYHVRQTSRRVIRHGVQVSRAGDFQPWDYGRRENLRRYGTPNPPSYGDALGMLGLYVDVVAGGTDELIPVCNLERLTASLNSHGKAPTAKLTVFPTLGHLDFTLGLTEQVIGHVLREVNSAVARPDEWWRSGHVVPSQQRLVHNWLNSFTNADMVFAALDAQFAPAQAASVPSCAPPAVAGSWMTELIMRPVRWVTSPLAGFAQRVFV